MKEQTLYVSSVDHTPITDKHSTDFPLSDVNNCYCSNRSYSGLIILHLKKREFLT